MSFHSLGQSEFNTNLAKETKNIAPITSWRAVSNGPAPEDGSYPTLLHIIGVKTPCMFL